MKAYYVASIIFYVGLAILVLGLIRALFLG